MYSHKNPLNYFVFFIESVIDLSLVPLCNAASVIDL